MLLTLLYSLTNVAFVVPFLTRFRTLIRDDEKLLRRKFQEMRAKQAKSGFLAAMSHKLRAALTSMCAFAELMEFCSQEPLIRLGAEHLNAL